MGQASAASCTTFYNVGAEDELAGSGSGNPVTFAEFGNCFHTIASGASAYGNWNVWQNGDGNCLVSNDRALDLNHACTTSNTAYQILSPGTPGASYNFVSTVSMEYTYGN
jgi:hypothetical protein